MTQATVGRLTQRLDMLISKRERLEAKIATLETQARQAELSGNRSINYNLQVDLRNLRVRLGMQSRECSRVRDLLRRARNRLDAIEESKEQAEVARDDVLLHGARFAPCLPSSSLRCPRCNSQLTRAIDSVECILCGWVQYDAVVRASPIAPWPPIATIGF